MQGHLCSEDQTLLLLARGELTPHMQEQALVLLATPLCWDLLLERATVEEVYPLLHRNLGRLGFPGVPAQVCTELEALYKINAFRNVHLAEELAQVLKLLEGADIPTIPLKGVALAESLYGDLALRVCADIDIIVPRRMASQALHLLLSRGYGAKFAGRFFEEAVLRKNIEYELVREERSFHYLLELHWGILLGAPWDDSATDDLWAEARPQVCFGAPGHTLSPEWQLLYLAAHAAHHQWQGLKWLVDIHEVCSRGKVDWGKVQEKAQRLGWEEILGLTLSACSALFDTLPPAHCSLMRLPPWLKLFPDNPAPQLWQSVLFPLRLLKHPSDRLRYILRGLFVPTPTDGQLLRLPSALSFLYYPLHVLRLGCKWGWRLVLAGLQRLRIIRK